MGTIGAHAPQRPDLVPLLRRLENFDVCGEFLLTEMGHGLDARNLETTATKQPGGGFKLHTPNSSAAKVMPPTSPLGGIPRVGVVLARLIVDGADHGVKPFIVELSDERGMMPGVSSQLLPKRCGAKALDHCITTFTNVRLSQEALLGSLDKPENERIDFMRQIHRVPVGTLSLSLAHIPMLKTSALIVGTYSCRRRVARGAEAHAQMPILSFPTQYRPILDTFVLANAFDAFADYAIAKFMDTSLPMEVRHGVAVCFKGTVTPDAAAMYNELAERCGWQGLFAYNSVIELGMAARGNAVAEGDYTVLCIRLVSEVLLGRYKLPGATTETILGRHEAGVWQEAREMMMAFGRESHRSEEANAYLLPRCRDIVKATGYRMAYEAAVASAKFRPEALALLESTCMKADLSWYCQHEGVKRNEFIVRDSQLARQALPLLQEFIRQGDASGSVVAPIMNQGSWDEFVDSLPMSTLTPVVAMEEPLAPAYHL
ncbi:acyl-CoA dehydrogenase/oxidase [Xylaria sp. CBS 124048]|nr:acyl-CoA dehydrogenase/oxidase [Xylaria sp. CBS 124048]